MIINDLELSYDTCTVARGLLYAMAVVSLM